MWRLEEEQGEKQCGVGEGAPVSHGLHVERKFYLDVELGELVNDVPFLSLRKAAKSKSKNLREMVDSHVDFLDSKTRLSVTQRLGL